MVTIDIRACISPHPADTSKLRAANRRRYAFTAPYHPPRAPPRSRVHIDRPAYSTRSWRTQVELPTRARRLHTGCFLFGSRPRTAQFRSAGVITPRIENVRRSRVCRFSPPRETQPAENDPPRVIEYSLDSSTNYWRSRRRIYDDSAIRRRAGSTRSSLQHLDRHTERETRATGDLSRCD